jgi:hypothetical protein
LEAIGRQFGIPIRIKIFLMEVIELWTSESLQLEIGPASGVRQSKIFYVR